MCLRNSFMPKFHSVKKTCIEGNDVKINMFKYYDTILMNPHTARTFVSKHMDHRIGGNECENKYSNESSDNRTHCKFHCNLYLVILSRSLLLFACFVCGDIFTKWYIRIITAEYRYRDRMRRQKKLRRLKIRLNSKLFVEEWDRLAADQHDDHTSKWELVCSNFLHIKLKYFSFPIRSRKKLIQ